MEKCDAEAKMCAAYTTEQVSCILVSTYGMLHNQFPFLQQVQQQKGKTDFHSPILKGTLIQRNL
jgi:hypothetical protein